MTESSTKATPREIVKHISDTAIELAFVRHSLTSDEVDVDDDASIKEKVEATEAFMEDVKEDTLNCLTGDDSGCLDPEELDETNCPLIWLTKQLDAYDTLLAERDRLRAVLVPFASQPIHHFEQGHADVPAKCPSCGPILRAQAALKEGE